MAQLITTESNQNLGWLTQIDLSSAPDAGGSEPPNKPPNSITSLSPPDNNLS